ncbi:MAG: hypothetical protein ACT4OT_08455 [Acidobacteriota bacterium]
MWKVLGITLSSLFFVATCFGQSSYKGLTPGTSTRAEVERVLGRPINKVSETLIEYAPPRDPDPSGYRMKVRVFVQHRDASATAVAERIAVVIKSEDANSAPALYWQSFDRSYGEGWQSGLVDAKIEVKKGAKIKEAIYIGDPLFAVYSFTTPHVNDEQRVEYYSPELYEGAVPKTGCTGTLVGNWDSELGRMTITAVERTSKFRRVTGTYSKNNGSFVGMADFDSLKGEWKDATGTGTLELRIGAEPYNGENRQAFIGDWIRQTGKGRGKVEVRGRCVDVSSGSR